MKDKMNSIIFAEIEALEKLHIELNMQHEYILKNEVFSMEGCVSRIEEICKLVAKQEVERRNLVDGRSMREFIDAFGDPILDKNFRELNKLVQLIKLQKDTNEMLIRQGLGFTNKMLNILNPDRGIKTYNAYGKVRR